MSEEPSLLRSIDATENRSVPRRWRIAPLGQVCRLVNGDAYKDSDWSSEGVPIVRIQNLNDHSKPFNYWAGRLDDRVLVNTGDVLLAWSGTPGTSFGAHLWRRGKGALNQHIFRVDIDTEVLLPQWAVWAINQQLIAMIGSAHGGVGLRHVKKALVEALPMVLPPLAEQRRIVAIVASQLAIVERAQVSAQAQVEAAAALPAAYLRTAFNSREAYQWPRKPLGEIAELLPSKSISTSGDCEVRTITTACLSESGFLPRGIKSARMRSADAAKSMVSAGEILVARSNTPELVGRAALFLGEAPGVVASDLTIRIRMAEGFSPAFVAAYLSFLYLSGYWKERAGGASGSMKKITRTQIQAEPVPVPSPDIQFRIAIGIVRNMEGIAALASSLNSRLGAIGALPATLLRRAFNGEV
ncbi:restriction endonuclease subunit S [Candidatus Binatus sp.]|uniref:restriction endonuclease subunit S n=2 Tax=Candidatus Binatus sp. TaxID=2811406 RepID=UPI003C331D5F